MASSSSSAVSASAPAPAVQAEAFPDGTTDFKPLRSKQYDIRKPHITEQPITIRNWYHHINWLNTTLILIIPACGLASSYWLPANTKTLLFAVLYYFHTGLGITAGKEDQLPPPPLRRFSVRR